MTRKLAPRIGLVAMLAAVSAWAQAPAATPAFEVASIKVAVPPNPADVMAGKLHVGMKVDGARVDIGFMSLSDLIRTAYNDQILPVVRPGLDGRPALRYPR